MLNAESCLISPAMTVKNINTILGWLKSGNPRGFILHDQEKTVVIFDGYGNTHQSMMKFFGLKNSDVTDEFILQKNGNLSFLHWKHWSLLAYMPLKNKKLFDIIAQQMNNYNVEAIPYE